MTAGNVSTTFDPTAIAGATETSLPPKTHNQPPEAPEVALFQQIDDLYDTAKDFADGEPIADDKMEAVITGIYNDLHKLGKEADELRVAEKKPLDDAVKAIQDKYNKYIQPKKGRVDMAKAALGDLLAPYRNAKRLAAEAEARRIAEEAETARIAANAAMQASSGNLAEREEAEERLAEAKRLETTARRANKAATTGTGLRTVWSAEIADESAALDWAYNHAPGEFMALALSLANEQVRAGVRSLPGFKVVEEKVAATGRAG